MASSEPLKEEELDKPTPDKQGCRESKDHISSLPDDIRGDIVSILPMQCAFRTCMLSRSWRRIFCSLPNLEFSESQFPYVEYRAERVASLIDWIVANHDHSDVSTLVIRFELSEVFTPLLSNEWITFAVQHNIKLLDLMGQLDDAEGLPNCLYSCRSQSMFRLVAQDQLLRLPAFIFLPNLTKLVLENVHLPDDASVEMLFSGCPLLEDLDLKRCNMFHLRILTISSPKLRFLSISQCVGIGGCEIYLQVPCIEYLIYDGVMARNFEFGNMNVIKEAWFILGRGPMDGTDYDWKPVPLSLPDAVRKVEVFSGVSNELRQLHCFSNLTQVRLCLCLADENRDSMLAILSKFIWVQQLRVFIDRRFSFMFTMKWDLENFCLEGIFSRLQYLQIDNFHAFDFETGLLELFLENAKSLSEVQIGIPAVAGEFEGRRFDWLRRAQKILKKLIARRVTMLSYEYPAVSIKIVSC